MTSSPRSPPRRSEKAIVLGGDIHRWASHQITIRSYACQIPQKIAGQLSPKVTILGGKWHGIFGAIWQGCQRHCLMASMAAAAGP